MSESPNGPLADGSKPLTDPSGSVKIVYRDGAISYIEIYDSDGPMIGPSTVFFGSTPCEHITPARKFRMLLHTNPTRERGECLGTRARASEDM